MEDKTLVQKISLLKDIKPKDNWVLFAKTQILSKTQEKVGQKLGFVKEIGHFVSHVRYLEKPAFVLATLALIVTGGVVYKVSQNSLPGDALYSVRSVIEKATTGSDPLEVAQRRLKDLRKVVEGNKVKNLSQATKDFNLSVSEVSKDLLALVENEPDKALQLSLKLVQLQKGKAQIEQILGAVIGEEETLELTNATKTFVESELTYLLNHTLTEEQNALLRKALFDYQAEDYGAALEKIWAISNYSL